MRRRQSDCVAQLWPWPLKSGIVQFHAAACIKIEIDFLTLLQKDQKLSIACYVWTAEDGTGAKMNAEPN